jgi:hypothetical protein
VNKLGFATPEARWQRTILKERILQAIHDPRLRPFIQPDAVERYFRLITENGRTDFTPWRLLSLCLWMEAFNL